MDKGKVLFLNGPPKAGKDYIGKLLQSLYVDSVTKKFAAPLKSAAPFLLGQRLRTWDSIEPDKDKLTSLGCTPREMLIWISERLMKPMLGEDIFGQLLVEDIINSPPKKFYIITDSGFSPEVKKVIKHFGKRNCMLWRLHREGADFTNDSRSYIDLDNIPCIDIINDKPFQYMKAFYLFTIYKHLCIEPRQSRPALGPNEVEIFNEHAKRFGFKGL